MNKYFLAIVLTLSCHYLFSQVNPPTQVQPVTSPKFAPIPSATAITIRKDVRDLNSAMGKLYDSIAVLKKEMDALSYSLKNELSSTAEMTAEMQTAIITSMQRIQQAYETASRMMKYVDELRKQLMDRFPQSRF
jgi:hypothetical protein